MNKDIAAWIDCWEKVRRRSEAFRDTVVLDIDSDQFDEIIILLNHSIHGCLSSQIDLINKQKFEGLIPLSRKIFESYVQLKYLAKYPDAKKHYALFERLKVSETYKYFLELNKSLQDSGEDPIANTEQVEYYKDRLKKVPDLISIFKGFGTEVGFFKDKKGGNKKWKTWYGNHGGFRNLEELAKSVQESRIYKLMYPTWSSSLHGQMVSIDYALSVSENKIITKNSQEYENECWNLFSMSFGAGFMSYMVTLIYFKREQFNDECEKLIEETKILGMEDSFRQFKEKLVDYYGL